MFILPNQTLTIRCWCDGSRNFDSFDLSINFNNRINIFGYQLSLIDKRSKQASHAITMMMMMMTKVWRVKSENKIRFVIFKTLQI